MSSSLRTTGATILKREQLKNIPAPEPTPTWKPIRHYDLITTLDNVLKKKGIEIQKEELAVQQNGAIFFGVLDLKSDMRTQEYNSSLGIRASNNKRIAIQIAVGARVFVCDNLVFTGDMIALSRKHTSKLSIEEELSNVMNTFSERFEHFSEEVAKMKSILLHQNKIKEFIFDIFIRKNLLPIRLMKTVAGQFFEPEFEEFKEPNLWSLHNSFTYAARKLSEDRRFNFLKYFALEFRDLLSKSDGRQNHENANRLVLT